MVTPEDSEFFRVLTEAHRRSLESSLVVGRYIGGWGDIGLPGRPNIIFYGFGERAGDHSYDEYYELKDLAPVLKTLVYLVAAWRGRSQARKG